MHGEEDNTATPRDSRSRLGRVKFGSGRLPALWVAAPVGLVLSAALGLLFVVTHSSEPRPIVGGVALAFTTVGICTGLAWALIVDFDTVRGATQNPEQSVESAWYDRAASGAFTDTLITTGLGAAAFSFVQVDISISVALAAVILIAMTSFAVRYFTLHRKG